jgi:hypothetical protein
MICGSDSFAAGLSYLNYTQKFYSSINNASDFKNLLNQNNVPFSNSTIVNDLYPPVLNLTVSSNAFKASTGQFYFMASNPTTVNCFWQLTFNVTPTFNQIMSCDHPYYCGRTIIPTTTIVASNNSALIPFSYSKSYTIYLACLNNIANAVTQSNVTALWTFYTGAPPPGSKKNTTNSTNSTNKTNTNSTMSGSQGKYNYQLSLLTSIVFVLILLV